jgi:hypothetical protein
MVPAQKSKSLGIMGSECSQRIYIKESVSRDCKPVFSLGFEAYFALYLGHRIIIFLEARRDFRHGPFRPWVKRIHFCLAVPLKEMRQTFECPEQAQRLCHILVAAGSLHEYNR